MTVDMPPMSSISSIQLSSGKKQLSLDQPLVMGILNLTPDSFYDGGKYTSSIDLAISRVNTMIGEGAAIIDIGAASTKPGATLINPGEEQARLVPFFVAIRNAFPETWISIDTYHASTAEICLEKGADLINDISAGLVDEALLSVVGTFQCPYVLMHMQGRPDDMQKEPRYENVVEEVSEFFNRQIDLLNQYGIRNIVLDPGFGFGKTVGHNFELLKHLDHFSQRFDLPILAGMSRKSMVNRVLGIKPEDALNGTTALHMLALLNGASILRVHDVKEAKQTIQLFEKYRTTH
jgi:dihydropteroate synthase